MSSEIEILNKLESKVHAALESIEYLKIELEEQKKINTKLQQDNDSMSDQLDSWNVKTNDLLARVSNEINNAL